MVLVCTAKGCPRCAEKLTFPKNRRINSADSDFLSDGGYSVKYLDYDWSLNGK